MKKKETRKEIKGGIKMKKAMFAISAVLGLILLDITSGLAVPPPPAPPSGLVPEPSTLILLGSGAAALGIAWKIRNGRK